MSRTVSAKKEMEGKRKEKEEKKKDSGGGREKNGTKKRGMQTREKINSERKLDMGKAERAKKEQ
jgi:hypothetical protein